MTYDAFVQLLLAVVPSYKPDNPDLPHAVLGGLVSWLREERDRDQHRYASGLSAVSAFIETAAASTDKRITDLVQVSFIENLHLLGGDCGEILTSLGPNSRHLAEEYEEKWGPVCR